MLCLKGVVSLYLIIFVIRQFDFSPNVTITTFSVEFKGRTYWKGLFLYLADIEDNVCFGEIELMLVKDNSTLYFIIRKCKAQYMVDFGWYHLTDYDDDILPRLCVSASDLRDYYPLPMYTVQNSKVIVLHHSVVEFQC